MLKIHLQALIAKNLFKPLAPTSCFQRVFFFFVAFKQGPRGFAVSYFHACLTRTKLLFCRKVNQFKALEITDISITQLVD